MGVDDDKANRLPIRNDVLARVYVSTLDSTTQQQLTAAMKNLSFMQVKTI